jgi:hypothetical protein
VRGAPAYLEEMNCRTIFVSIAAILGLSWVASSISWSTAAAKDRAVAPVASAGSLTLEGVEVPKQQTLSGRVLELNGAGVRTVKLGPIPIKAYVASLYTPQPLRSGEAVMSSPGPFVFNFRFLQGVSQKQVTKAWRAQFEESCTHVYEGYEEDLENFVNFFGPLDQGGVKRVVIEDDELRAYVGEEFKGSVGGRGFQKSFLSLWFGSKPVMPSLEKALLGS